MERIGIIGLGRMGSALAKRLADQGWPVIGWTRSGLTQDRAADLGITAAADLPALVATSDVILLSLFDDAAVGAIVDALCDTEIAGRLIADTSTVSPAVLKSRQEALTAAGAGAVDAPISGGPELVLSGAAGVFIGGTEADAARLRPVAEAFAARVFHVGPLGAGMAMKTINNGILQAYWAALAEMAALAKRAGLRLDQAMTILAGGPAAPPMFRDRLPKILGEDQTVGFPVAGVAKDADVFLRVAADAGAPSKTLTLGQELVARGVAEGLAEADLAALISAAYSKA